MIAFSCDCLGDVNVVPLESISLDFASCDMRPASAWHRSVVAASENSGERL